jgi:bifunctional non-homologous end joining protein LigD
MKQGSSDKAYNVYLKASGDGWMVEYANGKFGGTLKSGLKTTAPVSLDAANEIFDKLVNSKMKGGYTDQGSGVAFSSAEFAGRVTEFAPQLLNEISKDDLESLITSYPGAWFAQEKYDGERRGAFVLDGVAGGANRKGLSVAIPQAISDALMELSQEIGDFEFDCEAIGEQIAVFDVLRLSGENLRNRPALERADLLPFVAGKLASITNDIFVADKVILNSVDDLNNFVARHRALISEGIVIKQSNAPYSPGRPSSGGSQFKLPFTHRATLRVAEISNGVRSVRMEVSDGTSWVSVGKVTIPPNYPVPEVGALIDASYLYAYRDGALFQPVYKGERTDLDETAANKGQLFYKGEGRDPVVSGAYDRPDLAESYGFRVDPKSVFISKAPDELLARAADVAIGDGGYSWAVWDPSDDSDGFLLVGDNEGALRKSFKEHAENHFDQPSDQRDVGMTM